MWQLEYSMKREREVCVRRSQGISGGEVAAAAKRKERKGAKGKAVRGKGELSTAILPRPLSIPFSSSSSFCLSLPPSLSPPLFLDLLSLTFAASVFGVKLHTSAVHVSKPNADVTLRDAPKFLC